MSNTVIRVENLGKKYIIGHKHQGAYGHKTLRDTITGGARSISNKFLSPFNKKMLNLTRGEEFWALKDISFEINQGDRVGIIGHNGAGKSTLLKILSRITEPTTGKISIKGRVASLLEVGTGFHPELTGRENIYLNGAILGMSKIEIKKKFDEIVDFAEVEKFLDTPVKRYSSGMYVRLAFAVAAHLEPEILIVDEVLAVGDVQFQKKCLGKMQEVSQDQGRTVLFVSHNIQAIQRLCHQCVMLEHGQLISYKDTASSVMLYLSKNSGKSSANEWIDVSNVSWRGTGAAHFVAVKYSSLNEAAAFHPYSKGPLEFLLAIVSDSLRSIASLAVIIFDQLGNKLVNADTISLGRTIKLQKGRNILELRMEELYLNPGTYMLGLWLANPSLGEFFYHSESVFKIEVVDIEFKENGVRPNFDGVVKCNFSVLEAT